MFTFFLKIKLIPSYCSYLSYHYKVNQTLKRGSMLVKMIQDKDKKKNWNLSDLVTNVPKGKNIFEKIHRPSKRLRVLNSLFIENISDVFSTGDITPELLGSGIEITGVQVSQDYQLVNVFWQTPLNSEIKSEYIQTLLNTKAPKIRAELISRNVLGKVPRIYFVRDVANAKAAEFEEALKQIDIKAGENLPIIPETDFVKDIYKFKEAKKKEHKVPKQTTKLTIAEQTTKVKNAEVAPDKLNMKANVFGLDYNELMSKVEQKKKKSSATAAVKLDGQDQDLFDKIQGTSFQNNNEREKLMKQFCIERKKKRKQINEDYEFCTSSHMENMHYNDEIYQDQDYIEEDTSDKF